jgi:hypothetical protein
MEFYSMGSWPLVVFRNQPVHFPLPDILGILVDFFENGSEAGF